MQRSKLTFDHFRQMEQLELQFYGLAPVCCSDHESRVFEQSYESFCAKVMCASGGQG